MQLDYYLIARAEKLAAEHVHSIANLLTPYFVGWELGTPEGIALAMEAEKRLRSMVAEAEYSAALQALRR